MSRVLVDPNQAVSQISRISCSRETTLPCSRTSTRSRSNSLAVSCSSSLVEPGAPALGVDPHDRRSDGAASVGRAAQQGPHPGQQLGQPERLGDVVVGAGVEPDDRVDLVGAGGEDEDRDRPARRPGCAGTPRGRRCAAARGRGRTRSGFSLAPSRAARPSLADVDVVALPPQRSGQRLGDGGVVLGQQHSGHGRIVDRDRRDSATGPRRAALLGEGGDALGAVAARRPSRASSRPRPPARWPGRRRPRAASPAWPAAARPASSPRSVRRAPAPGRGRVPAGTTSSTHPERSGLGGGHPAGGEDHPGRPRPADPAGQQLRAAAAGDDADATPRAARRRPPHRRRRGRRTARSPARRRGRSPRPRRARAPAGPAPRRTPPRATGRCSHQVGVGEAVALLEVRAHAERLRAGAGHAPRSARSRRRRRRRGGAARPRAMAVETAFMASGRSRTSSATWPAVAVPRDGTRGLRSVLLMRLLRRGRVVVTVEGVRRRDHAAATGRRGALQPPRGRPARCRAGSAGAARSSRTRRGWPATRRARRPPAPCPGWATAVRRLARLTVVPKTSPSREIDRPERHADAHVGQEVVVGHRLDEVQRDRARPARRRASTNSTSSPTVLIDPAAVGGDDVGRQRLEALHDLGELALGQPPDQRGERRRGRRSRRCGSTPCVVLAGSASASMREMAAVRCRRHA